MLRIVRHSDLCVATHATVYCDQNARYGLLTIDGDSSPVVKQG